VLGDVYFVDLKGNRPGTPAGKWPDPQPAAAPRNTPETQRNRRSSSTPAGLCRRRPPAIFPSHKIGLPDADGTARAIEHQIALDTWFAFSGTSMEDLVAAINHGEATATARQLVRLNNWGSIIRVIAGKRFCPKAVVRLGF
jgi:hypothetical protein